MAATVYFAGGETEAFNRSSTNVNEQTNGGTFNATYARCAIRINTGSTTDWLETLTFGSVSTVWCHFDLYSQVSFANSSIPMVLYDGSGNQVVRMNWVSGNFGTVTFQMQYWNGSAWTNMGSTFTLPTDTLNTIDLQVTNGATGSFTLYLGNSIIASATGVNMTGGVANFNKLRFNNNSSTGGRDTFISQVIVADSNTVGWKFYLKPPTGNSATNTAFSSDFTAVDETLVDDTDFIESTSVGDTETYTHGSITIPAGAVKAVVVSVRGKNVATGPQNVQACLRIGSTNYTSANLAGISTGYGAMLGIFAQDPSTGVAWTNAAAVSTSNEFGVKSAT